VKKSRYYPGQVEADQILPWLNRGTNRRGKRRMEELLSALHEFHSISFPSDRGLKGLEIKGKFRMAKMLLVKRWEDIQPAGRAHRRINQALSRYLLTPQLGSPTEFGWQVYWYPPHKRRNARKIESEASVLLNVLELAKQGQVDRLRRCDGCAKWHFAKFKHQRFCSTKCQQGHYKKSPSWRNHRLAYMRRYRRIRNLPNVK